MRTKSIRAIAMALLAASMILQSVPAQTDPSAHGGSGPSPLETSQTTPVWTDELDDLSHVYLPQGGLVGVELVDGAIQLEPGADEGWVASEVIKAEEDFNYDLVVLEAEVPDDSRVEISVLNASRESSEVGFANETIPPFVKVERTDVYVYSIDPKEYPRLRIQVNLVANNTQRPRLLSWSFHYIALDEWREEFLGTAKMSEMRNLNLTDGTAEIDMSPKLALAGSGTTAAYDAYPPVAVAGWTSGLKLFYPNAAMDGYEDELVFESSGYSYGVTFGDLDMDGYLDLVSNDYYDRTRIYWGDESGTWSNQDYKELVTTRARSSAIGDLNGDGAPDLAVACYVTGGGADSVVFLNDGQGGFNNQPEITFQDWDYRKAAAADLNSDGYDDLVFSTTTEVICLFGGDEGPDSQIDITIQTGTCYDIAVEDLDGDGHIDLALAERHSGACRVFLGGPSGPDTTADYTLTFGGSWCLAVASGDINGDGYTDIVYYTSIGNGEYTVFTFTGSGSGWSDSNRHDGYTDGYSYCMDVADVNRDGYDDVVLPHRTVDGTSYKTAVLEGGSTLPTTASITKDGGGTSDVAVAIDREGPVVGRFGGMLETIPIELPEGQRWDVLHIEGHAPQNTTVSVSVLDGSGADVSEYKDLSTMDLDLSGVTVDTIRLRVVLRSEFNHTTPTLDSVMVKWVDELAWRDEFYGDVKADSLMNLAVDGGVLKASSLPLSAQQLVFPSLRDDDGYDSASTAYFPVEGAVLDAYPPVAFKAKGASSAHAADVNGDGYQDVAFAVQRGADDVWNTDSVLFLGGPTGWRPEPDHEFPSVGTSDILLSDLNGDGHHDVVIAQERNGDDYRINSTLFWGREGGWNSTPDLEFTTSGATGVIAADINSDGLLDLAFSCFKSVSTNTESMVFLQREGGEFCSTADISLQTRGARDVAAGDVDGDGNVDLVFANALSGGFAEIDSYVYWGLAGAGFVSTPSTLATKGAEAVEVADLDGDGDLDIAFANYWDNNRKRAIDSYAYLCEGSRVLPSTPSGRFPTVGATGVASVDLDGSGRKDLVFACQDNGTSFAVPSRLFLGGPLGWSSVPDALIPTSGASHVLATSLWGPGSGGYMSHVIKVDAITVGSFRTLRYSAELGGSQGGKVQLVDAITWEVLFERDIASGEQVYDVSDSFKVKAHPSVRVVVTSNGLDKTGTFELDDLWLNWSLRVPKPPEVRGLEMGAEEVYRRSWVQMNLSVYDEFDPGEDLYVTLEHRLNSSDEWRSDLLETLRYKDGAWRTAFFPKSDTPTGVYHFRAWVRDSDGETSGHVEFTAEVKVLNNVPSVPEVRILPARPVTSADLGVEIFHGSEDVENSIIQYRFAWFLDGVPLPDQTNDTIPSSLTGRGDNWSVEVRAFDGEDLSPPALAWRVVQNSPPRVVSPPPDPEFDEDTTDNEWVNVLAAFKDPDGDALTFTIDPVPEHLTVTIDPVTGTVTIVPEENWHGSEAVNIIASDGELRENATITVTVLPVNDPPRIVGINGHGISSDPMEFTVKHGETLELQVNAIDVEGHQLVYEVNTTAVEVGTETGMITFTAEPDAMGSLRFGIWVHDVMSPGVKARLNITIHIENENDPMEDPRITGPVDGERFKEDETFFLTAVCTDPDEPWGQELNFSWSSNVSGHLGYGRSLEVSLSNVGAHRITLTVTDGHYQKLAHVELTIVAREGSDPPPGPDPDLTVDEEGLPLGLVAVLAVLVVVGALGFMVLNKRRSERLEAVEEEAFREEQKREGLARAAATLKEVADGWEQELEEAQTEDDQPWVEVEQRDGIEVSTGSVPKRSLSIEARVTDKASRDVQALWNDIGSETAAPEEDKEQLRLDSLKRRYQNAIGRLPYGIPSRELADRDWVDLAHALATGEKKEVDDGKEVTLIDGRWYYSEVEDSGTFLKEHGASPREKRKAVVASHRKEALLAKLEERFILGEITEEAYKELKEKYGG